MQNNNKQTWEILRSAILGMVVGVFLHYLLYRLTLPSEPFIYVSF